MRIFVIVMIFQGTNSLASAAAPAHSHAITPEMRRQHQAMSQASKHWLTCTQCIETDNWGAAEEALVQMRKSLADLEKFKPHKNAGKSEAFREASRSFQGNVAKLEEALKARDSSAIPVLIKTIEKDCRDCHGSFR